MVRFTVPLLLAGLTVPAYAQVKPTAPVPSTAYVDSRVQALTTALAGKAAQYVTGRAPTATDDATAGYAVGAYWRHAGQVYRSIQSTVGAAVWTPVTSEARPLDLVPNAAAAYGTTLLRSAYTGAAMNVTRVSDGVAQDIGFRPDGQLDVAALDAFMGSGVGIATIYDQSGNNRSGTQSTPALRATILPPAKTGRARTIVFPVNSNFGSCCNIFNISGANFAGNAFSLVSVGSFAASLYPAGTFEASGATSYTFGQFTNYSIGLLGTAGNATSIRGRQTPSVQMVVSGTNGVAISQDEMSYAGPANAATALTSLYLGGTGSNPSRSGGQEIAAFLLYARALSGIEQDRLRASLYTTLEMSPQVRDTLMIKGDSITAGITASSGQTYPRKVEPTLGRPRRVYNLGISGQTLEEAVGNFTNETANIAGPGDNLAMLFMGTNSVTLNNTSATTLLSLTAQWVSKARALGYRVIVGTMLPRTGWNAGQEATRVAFNAALRAASYGPAGIYGDALVDFAADPYLSTANLPDGVHPDDVGYAHLAILAASTIARMQ